MSSKKTNNFNGSQSRSNSRAMTALSASRLVNQHELVRQAAYILKKQPDCASIEQSLVGKVLTALSKYISVSFQKIDSLDVETNQLMFNSVVVNVPQLGHFTLERMAHGTLLKQDFVPSQMMSAECGLKRDQQKVIGAASGPTLNREFSTDNVARLLKLKPFEVKSVLNALVKTIILLMKEQKPVAIDIHFDNRYAIFSLEGVQFLTKNATSMKLSATIQGGEEQQTHTRAASAIDTLQPTATRPFNEELPENLRRKVAVRRHGAPAVFKNYKKSLSIASSDNKLDQRSTLNVSVQQKDHNDYDYDIASGNHSTRSKPKSSTAFNRYRASVLEDQQARSRADLNELSRGSDEMFEGGNRETRTDMTMLNNTRMQDFLTLKVGSCGKETKLQELMQLGSGPMKKSQFNKLDSFLATQTKHLSPQASAGKSMPMQHHYLTSDQRSQARSAISRGGSSSASRFSKFKMQTGPGAKLEIDKTFLMNNETGKQMTMGSKNVKREVFQPLDRYTSTADTHFKYSVYNMKRDVDNTHVQNMAATRHDAAIKEIDRENAIHKRNFYRQLEAYNELNRAKKQIAKQEKMKSRGFWDIQIEERKNREAAEHHISKHAPVGSPLNFLRQGRSDTTRSVNLGSKSSFPVTRSRGNSMKSAINFYPTTSPIGAKTTQFEEFNPLNVYPFPVEDAPRTVCQTMHAVKTKDDARKALLEQIEYNQMKKRVQKASDIMIGQKLIADAHENLTGEGIFATMRKKKAQELMKQQWKESMNTKANMKNARNVFI